MTVLRLSRLTVVAYAKALITTKSAIGATTKYRKVWIALKAGPGTMPGSKVVKRKFIA
jgi:hypothetical protein